MKKIAYVGVDYHLHSLSIAVMLEGEKKFYDLIRLKNMDKVISKYMKKLSSKFEINHAMVIPFRGRWPPGATTAMLLPPP